MLKREANKLHSLAKVESEWGVATIESSMPFAASSVVTGLHLCFDEQD